MDYPAMLDTLTPAPDTTSIVSYTPIPGFGVLPVNAFVIAAKEPLLVDTGLSVLGESFMEQLRRTIDPGDLRWIWLTHTDADHIGNLERVLAEAPHARVVTSFLGLGKLGLMERAPERVFLVNPGQALDVGDRKLVAVRPPTFDAPETTGLFDARTRTFFSADSFGALMDEPVDHASAIDADRMREGLKLWATVDAPWLHMVEDTRFRQVLREILVLGATTVLSSHLPPATDIGRLLDWIDEARHAPTFAGPDQEAVEALMSEQPVST
jgi:flavorubredoxin